MATIGEIVGLRGSLNADGNIQWTRTLELTLGEGESSNFFNPAYILNISGVPRAGSRLDGTNCYLTSMEVQQDSNRSAPDRYILNLEYNSFIPPGVDLESLFSGSAPDPEFIAPEIEWDGSIKNVYSEVDSRGYRICNSAGDAPIPKEPQFLPIQNVSIRYFVRRKPPGILTLQGAVNSNQFTIDDESIPPQCALIRNVKVSKKALEKGVVGRWVSINMEIGPELILPKTSDIKFVNDSTAVNTTQQRYGHWTGNFLDKGRRQYNATVSGLVPLQDDDTGISQEPGLLDGTGRALAKPVAVGSEVYRIYYPYRVLNFSLLRLT